jgi:hypothetical protein
MPQSGCIDPRFLDLGFSWMRVVSFTPRQLNTPRIGGRLCPKVVLDSTETLAPNVCGGHFLYSIEQQCYYRPKHALFDGSNKCMEYVTRHGNIWSRLFLTIPGFSLQAARSWIEANFQKRECTHFIPSPKDEHR